jgi:hypothetical protein
MLWCVCEAFFPNAFNQLTPEVRTNNPEKAAIEGRFKLKVVMAVLIL